MLLTLEFIFRQEKIKRRNKNNILENRLSNRLNIYMVFMTLTEKIFVLMCISNLKINVD